MRLAREATRGEKMLLSNSRGVRGVKAVGPVTDKEVLDWCWIRSVARFHDAKLVHQHWHRECTGPADLPFFLRNVQTWSKLNPTLKPSHSHKCSASRRKTDAGPEKRL